METKDLLILFLIIGLLVLCGIAIDQNTAITKLNGQIDKLNANVDSLKNSSIQAPYPNNTVNNAASGAKTPDLEIVEWKVYSNSTLQIKLKNNIDMPISVFGVQAPGIGHTKRVYLQPKETSGFIDIDGVLSILGVIENKHAGDNYSFSISVEYFDPNDISNMKSQNQILAGTILPS